MFSTKFNWLGRKKQSFYILSLFSLFILLVLSVNIYEPASILSPVLIQFSKEFRKSESNKCFPHECTLEQNQRHGDRYASFTPAWSGCYGDFYLMAFDNYDTSVYTLIDVGSNKAYAVATWFAFFSPELKINQASLHHYLLSTGKLTYVCGSCNDCEDKPLKRNSINQNVTLYIHAFEPQPDTVNVLKGVQAWMKLSEKTKSTLDIYGMAVSNYDGQVSFKKCNSGNEVCSLDVSKTSPAETVQVGVMTLDHFADQHKLSKIDILKIDTEGYEPFVFQGAKRLLQQHRIRLFIFEHLKIAAWLNTSLQIEVSKLADIGYVCYMIGQTGLIRVTNCWNDKFDAQHNNLLCVSLRDGKLSSSIDQMKLTNTIPIVCGKT